MANTIDLIRAEPGAEPIAGQSEAERRKQFAELLTPVPQADLSAVVERLNAPVPPEDNPPPHKPIGFRTL